MQTIRCVIVDDEPLAREVLRSFISRDRSLELVGEAGDGVSAVSVLEETAPDVVFLDIQMPELDGFDVLRELERVGTEVPVVIFVTAYDEYALRAFEAHALDYLLKPFDEKRFQTAVTAARKRLRAERSVYTATQLMNMLAQSGIAPRTNGRIAVKSKGRIVFIQLRDVEWIEADGNYLGLHIGPDTHIVRGTMNAFETQLNPAEFVRIHRSTIVNLNAIKELQPWFTGEYVVRLKNGKELTLSRKYRDRVLGNAGLSAEHNPEK